MSKRNLQYDKVEWKKWLGQYLVPASGKFSLADYATDEKDGPEKDEAAKALAEDQTWLTEAQNVLYAEGKHSLLIVLQAMDTGGKDGTIRTVFGPLNPQGVRVHSFKGPNPKELAHDFLWRIHSCTPKKGMIHIFNRSHYEDVLIARVHNLAPAEIIERRYQHINNFEALLADSGTQIIKFFLNITKDEQKRRLQERLDDAQKHWKFSSSDLKERDYWEDYQKAYEKALRKCSTAQAPWYVIPADRKWRRNMIVTRIIRRHLDLLKCKYPASEPGLEKVVLK